MTDTIISENTIGAFIGHFSGTNDCYIDESEPTSNINGTNLQVTNDDGTPDDGNTLIAFTGLSNISASEIASAVTFGWYNAGGTGGTRTIDFHRLLVDWVESEATWNIFSTGEDWTTPGAESSDNDRSSTITGSYDASTTGQWYTLDSASNSQLLTDGQNFIDGGYPNYGWVVDTQSGGGGDKNHHSSEGTDGLRPYLLVTHAAAGGAIIPVGFKNTNKFRHMIVR